MFLEIEHLTMQFGGLVAVKDLSMSVRKGELHGLIGPNGSGKTTIFNVLSGYYKPTGGSVRFEGKEVAGLPAYQITQLGFARTFQNLRLFSSMTVLDNVLVGMGHHGQIGVWEAIFSPVAVAREERDFLDRAMKLLELLEITDYAGDLATSLPYGHQRRVEIARALATQPKLLLLDEPAAGLNNIETQTLREILAKIINSGITILLVEHDMKLVMEACETITVLDYGKKIAEGTAAAVSGDPVVVEAYLGQEEVP
jgi:branched-chain amino acid transport system ATP-binding protein